LQSRRTIHSLRFPQASFFAVVDFVAEKAPDFNKYQRASDPGVQQVQKK
jgi:hypothetical protein